MIGATRPVGGNVPGRLPAPTAEMFGRGEELDQLMDMIIVRRHRLVTITGLGGSGKTRLAIEAAWQVRPRFANGVHFVDLSDVTDADGIADELSRQLDIATIPDLDPIDRLCTLWSDHEALIVVDNVEQVPAAARDLGRLTSSCPAVSLLITSRRRLRLGGERLLPLSPLAVPTTDAEVSTNAAVALFCDRAAAQTPDFTPNATDLAAVAEICRRLDGLPLALELAAARSGSLPPRAMMAALTRWPDAPWELLDAAPVDAPPRQRTLYEAVTWSVDLLADHERALFRRLGVFAGSWSIEAAQLVCSGSAVGTEADQVDGTGSDKSRALDPASLFDALSVLVDLHLVESASGAGSPDGEMRYRMLETISAVARSLLPASGEEPDLRRRHAQYFLERILASRRGLESAEESTWYRRIDAEARDTGAALSWLAAHDRGADVVRAAAALGPYWLNRGRFTSGRRWLGHTASDVPATERVAARAWAIRLALDGRADAITPADASDLINELEVLRRSVDPAVDLTRWLRLTEHISYAHRLYGDAGRAADLSRQAIAQCEPAERSWWRAEHLLRLALLTDQIGDPSGARQYAAEALAAAEAGGNERVRARALQARLLSTPDVPDDVQAGRAAEVLAMSERFGDRRGAVTTRILLASLAWQAGDRATAAEEYARATTESLEIGYQHGVGLVTASLIAQDLGTDWRAAATLYGGLLSFLPTILRQLPAQYVPVYDLLVNTARHRAGPARFDAAVAAGSNLNWSQTVELVLSRTRRMVEENKRRERPAGRDGEGSRPGLRTPARRGARPAVRPGARGASTDRRGPHELRDRPKALSQPEDGDAPLWPHLPEAWGARARRPSPGLLAAACLTSRRRHRSAKQRHRLDLDERLWMEERHHLDGGTGRELRQVHVVA